MIKFVYTEEFCKEFKALAKKYRSLGDIDDNKGDFFVLKELIEFDPISNNAVERINQLGKDIILHIYKVKKFYCNDLKSTTKLRVIYSYDECIQEIQLIQFLEIYAKSDKENEDRKRIAKYAS